LPKPSIDTGMGLERISAVMQGTHDNYEVDMLRNLILASADATSTDPDGEHAVSHRVIADHLRASSFLIADGVLPSNEGRGYVLRRIMRRAMRHAQMIGCKDPLMHRLVPALVNKMGAAFGELVRAQPLIEETLKLEEGRFKTTLERGLKLLDEESDGLGDGDSLSGEVAFKLYDTYGFPVDLTQDALKARNIQVDMEGYGAAMERQKAEARAAWKGSGDAATDQIWFDIREELGSTEFLGYETETAEGQITALVVDGEKADEAREGQTVSLVTNQTPFYGESGGQMGDVGIITVGSAEVTVEDTLKKLGALHVHVGKVTKGTIKIGDDATLAVDGSHRAALRGNHSATHLLHEALRRRLGDHVTQKGSMVASERLRFDVSHPKAVLADELAEVEAEVNARVRQNSEVVTLLMTPEEAVEKGAMALFGEKYGDEVRVVSMGKDGDKAYSTELCGGTHVKRTGDIGVFKVVSEGAVAAGVRRIEALTGGAAFAYLEEQEKALHDAASLLKVAPAEVNTRIAALLEERKKLERELTEARKAAASGGGGASADAAKDVGGIAFMGKTLEGLPAKELKGLVDDMKNKLGSGVVAVVAVNEGKASLVVDVTKDLTGKVSAVDLVRAGSAAVGGKGGGGRPDMAQAGGPDGSKADEAVAAIEAVLAG
jgi:alanyl-tRNA synthetase